MRSGLIDELKLRVAYGETGNQPLYGQKFTPLDLSNIGNAGAFRIGTARGASDIRPERQRELEGGFDATLFGNRGTIDFTVFQRNISDLLITRTLPPTSGYASEISNGASMQVRGVESSLTLIPCSEAGCSGRRAEHRGQSQQASRPPRPLFLLGAFQVGAVRIEQGSRPRRSTATTRCGSRVARPSVF